MWANLRLRRPRGLDSWVGYTFVGFNFKYPQSSHHEEPKKKKKSPHGSFRMGKVNTLQCTWNTLYNNNLSGEKDFLS